PRGVAAGVLLLVPRPPPAGSVGEVRHPGPVLGAGVLVGLRLGVPGFGGARVHTAGVAALLVEQLRAHVEDLEGPRRELGEVGEIRVRHTLDFTDRYS